ncbi:hypothetical protein DHEL01_v212630 [Diaporthe helianthi]|uniref:Uncharacterized protein n=1 Tax=Diaporthe helianthi TaxID=158607 RepID=A0A2P5HFF1_DIAHE|nr:hypothetical protein DHEL01_v212630 [Diaporthe helianthi]
MILTGNSPSASKSLAGLLPLFFTASTLAQRVSLPSDIAVSLVFPRNDTYNPADRRLSVEPGDFGSVSFGSEDYYIYKDGSTSLSRNWGLGVAAGGFEGAYSLEWDFVFLRNCSDEGGALQSEGGQTAFSGRSTFSVAPGESPGIREQLEECPIPGGVIGVEANLDGCPRLGGAEQEESDRCDVEVPDAIISNVVALMAASGSPEQPGAQPIPGVPLPGGPTGVTTVIGYPHDDPDDHNDTETDRGTATHRPPRPTSPSPAIPPPTTTTTSSSRLSAPSEGRPSASSTGRASGQPSGQPTGQPIATPTTVVGS